jgi:GT2 family glycosyltransferase
MDISIIIVNWNTKALLLDCLTSVYATTAGLSIETIVVDNGSHDGSVQAVQDRFPQVTLIQNTGNRGFARANNQALARTTGRYVLLLNSDALLTEGALNNLVAFMDTTPGAGIAAGQYLNQDGSKQNSFDNFPTLATELLNKTLLRILLPNKYPSKKKEYREPMEVDSVIGACMLVRAEAIKQLGALDEDYFFFMEETDWCFRMHRAGWKIYHLPHINVYHLQGKSKEKNPSKAWIEYYRSVYIFFKKQRSPRSYYFLRIARVGKLLINMALVSLGLLLTLGMASGLKRRCTIYRDVLIWHIKLCPLSGGLRELDSATTDDPFS